MEILIVLVSLSAMALASLEPAGYQPPGASAQYLSPRLNAELQPQQQQLNPSAVSTSHSLEDPDSSSPYYYLPPQVKLPEPKPSLPASGYLPATEKPWPVKLPSPPSNGYLPPLPAGPVSAAPDYLPPRSPASPTSRPTTEYLPASRTPPAPPAGYLPPAAQTTTRPPPKTEYLPPPRPQSPITTQSSEYLPPSSSSSSSRSMGRKSGNTTPRLGDPSLSPYNRDPPTYADRGYQSRPPALTSSSASSTSLSSPSSHSSSSSTSFSVKGGAYSPRKEYSSGDSRVNVKSLEQPVDNYLPSIVAGKTEANDRDYSYGSGILDSAENENQATESAKYDFEYRVSDEFGNDFGHKETRAGSQTQGSYSVLLPDGRRQIVHYEADEAGFRPRVSYEEAATVLGPKTPAIAGYDGSSNGLDLQGPY